MKFGLMFFAASEDSLSGDKYRLVVESARFADEHGFSSVWVPERHFTSFGGLYPNPAVLHAALAMCTRRIRLNAGSVVAPLHHPIRIAEEWSVVDNLSHGRVGLSFASGWNPDDFVFFPDRYATRHEQVFDAIGAVQRLWRGEAIAATNGVGHHRAVKILPRPVQPELPVWVTAAGNPQTFARAGAAGAHLLTHLLDQDEQVLAAKIDVYRKARAAAGFDPSTGEVTVMLHTFVGADAAQAREEARQPYCEYIKANLGLLTGLARSRGREADLTTMSPADRDELVNFLYDRFASERGLIGTPESCAPLVSRLEHIGVTEAACLLDFGPDADLILANLPHLARLAKQDVVQAFRPAGAADSKVRTTSFDRDIVRQRCTREMSGDEFHAVLRRRGIEVDGAFQTIRTVWRRDGEALAQLEVGAAGDADGYHVHPAALDACGRVLAAALPAHVFDDASRTVYVPAGMRACEVHGPLTGIVWSHALLAANENGRSLSFAGDVRVYDEQGRALVEIEGLRLEPINTLDVARPYPTYARAMSTRASTRAAEAPSARRRQGRDAVGESDTVSLRRLLYERTWHEAPAAIHSNGDASGAWLVIADRADSGDGGGVGAELVRLIGAHGGACTNEPAPGTVRGVVYLRALDADPDPTPDTETLERHVELAVRGILDVMSVHRSTPIWIVTRGAMPVLRGAHAIGVAQAPLWGLARVLAVERQGSLGALVDLDPAASAPESARHLLDVITSTGDEDMLAFRGGEPYVPRLARLGEAPAGSDPLAFGSDDTVLITGGSGGLGLRLAAWLVERGASHLILVSRRAPSPQGQAAIDRLVASGADVVSARADVSDYQQLKDAMDRTSAGRPPLTSVFHLAGVLDDGRLEGQTWERFARVFEPKIAGAWHLHLLTRGMPLRHFVMFSSVASIVPVAGQSNYAAANAFLDALAHHRRGEGLPALAVNWGPWAEAGHAASEYGQRSHEGLGTLGIKAIAPDDGLRVMGALMEQGRTQAAAIDVDWRQLFRADPAAARLGLLAERVREAAAPEIAASGPPSELVAALRALPPDERRPYLLRHLSDLIVAALKVRTGEPIDSRQRLFDLGLDSILAIEVKDQLERSLGRKLSATLLFVHPTLEALSAYILDEIVGAGAAFPAAPVAASAAAIDLASLSEEELALLVVREIDAGHGR